MRPLKGHLPGWIELLKQVMDEGANGIYTAVHGVEPESMSASSTIGFHLELPIFQSTFQFFWEVWGQFVSLASLAGLVVDFEGVFLGLCIGQIEDQAEVGEIVGHVSFLIEEAAPGFIPVQPDLRSEVEFPDAHAPKALHKLGGILFGQL